MRMLQQEKDIGDFPHQPAGMKIALPLVGGGIRNASGSNLPEVTGHWWVIHYAGRCPPRSEVKSASSSNSFKYARNFAASAPSMIR
jgi:hypothetical protein